jgi:hypothetical protein
MISRLLVACFYLFLAVSISATDGSEKTHPVNPAELRDAIGHADRIDVYVGNVATVPGTAPLPPLYSSESKKDIVELREVIVVEPPKAWYRCACLPPIEIKLSQKGRNMGWISVEEDLTIEFSTWNGDTRPVDDDKLLHWFDVRGIDAPRKGVERLRRVDEESRAAEERWLRAMPAALRPMWPKLLKDGDWWRDPPSAVKATIAAADPYLVVEFPDVSERIRALMTWFGSGAGPWSGFPAYEDVAADLLLEYRPNELVEAMRRRPLTATEMEGAARFFSGYTYGALFRPREDKKLIGSLPPEIKKALLQHVIEGGDPDKIERAQSALGPN